MDAKDLQRRWKEVLKTCGLELNTAAPGDKAKWVKAQAAAQLVVDSLAPIIQIEKTACKAWQEARLEKSDKPQPVFRLVTS